MNTKAPSLSISRRAFLHKAVLAAGAAALGSEIGLRAGALGQDGAKIPAAIIGHTGRGDYGHGLDQVFNDRQNIQVVGIADPVSTGRAKAAERSKALRQYDDYHEMLEREKPRLVCIAPRWTDQHHVMALAAFKIGAHIYMEKPITPSLAEADELLAQADRAGLKIAMAHQMRLAPSILHLKTILDEGLLGELLHIRAYGKQDSRAGGEDMLVLGTHIFDLVRFFGGNASWCTARALQNGREITRQDAHAAKESIGLIAGDEIEAQFGLAKGVTASFTSRGKLREQTAHWGLELIGSKTSARILADIFPAVYLLKAGPWNETGKSDVWVHLENDPSLKATAAERSTDMANKRVVDDWLAAIEKNRQPTCSGHAAMKSLEMIMAVYQASLSGCRVSLPLVSRAHPLG
jgi:predicted dehydrogenase